jgi:hypothetical protein
MTSTSTRTLRQHVSIVQDLETSNSFDYKINLSFNPDKVTLRELQYIPNWDLDANQFDGGLYRVNANLTPQNDTLGFITVGITNLVDVHTDSKSGGVISDLIHAPMAFYSNPQSTFTLTNFTNNTSYRFEVLPASNNVIPMGTVLLHLEFSREVPQ